MDFQAKGRGGRVVGARRRNRDAVATAINSAIKSGEPAIPGIAADDAIGGMEKAFVSAARSAGAQDKEGAKAAKAALAAFKRLHERLGIPVCTGYLAEIDRVCACIWSDPRMADAAALWRHVKERRGKKSRPSLETHRADFEILSTVASMVVRGRAAKLLTFDHDFVAFAGAIRERLGVEVVDCAALPR